MIKLLWYYLSKRSSITIAVRTPLKTTDKIETNLKVIRNIFNSSIRPINLTAGFNVVVSTDKMKMQNELNDQIQLSREFGIGVLTSSSFCELDSSSNYFIRFGLSLDEQTFKNTLLRINDFYKNK